MKLKVFKIGLVLTLATLSLGASLDEDEVKRTRVKRDGGATAALIAGGASLLTAGAGGGSSTLWQLPTGQKIDANRCWQDGSGPCANGNCLDDTGSRGVVIKETTVSCQWFCVWRAHCKTQICCPQV